MGLADFIVYDYRMQQVSVYRGIVLYVMKVLGSTPMPGGSIHSPVFIIKMGTW